MAAVELHHHKHLWLNYYGNHHNHLCKQEHTITHINSHFSKIKPHNKTIHFGLVLIQQIQDNGKDKLLLLLVNQFGVLLHMVESQLQQVGTHLEVAMKHSYQLIL